MISRRTISHLQYERMITALDQPTYVALVDGRWTPTTNGQALEMSGEVMAGLWALGTRHGDRVAVMSESKPEWGICDGAALDLGATVVSVYPTSTADATSYILAHSGSRVAFLENAEHWRLIEPHLAQLPDLKHVVIFDPEGTLPGDWISLDDLRSMGRNLLTEHPDLAAEARDSVQPGDLASLMYTSGTTGPPKGVALTHEMLYAVVETLDGLLELHEGEAGVVFLPMSHILQRVNVYLGRLAGVIGYFAPAITDLVPTCQEAKPRIISGVPRVFEKIHAAIMAGVEKSPPRRQKLFARAIEAGTKRAYLEERGDRLPLMLRILTALYERLIYAKLRTGIFGPNIEFLSSGAAPISREILEFFFAIGLPIFEGYGLTETCSPITYNIPKKYRIGTVGPPLPGSEVKIVEDGEVLLKGPSVFTHYYNDPESTAAAFTEDGWFMSGDIGELDEDGFLRITDRKKSLIITSAGKNIAPAPIEQQLLQHPLIGQVVVHGDTRKYLTALITLDPDGLAAWAGQNERHAADLDSLASDTELIAELERFVGSVNEKLARYETIKQFRILPEDFSVENGMLTPTLKIKRRLVEQNFADLLDEMYLAG